MGATAIAFDASDEAIGGFAAIAHLLREVVLRVLERHGLVTETDGNKRCLLLPRRQRDKNEPTLGVHAQLHELELHGLAILYRAAQAQHGAAGRCQPVLDRPDLDRKSTRLNSSH